MTDANANRPEVRTVSVDMRNEPSRAAQFAWAALLACTGVVVAAGFALTFHGLYGFGRHIAHWGPQLAALGPIADDGLTLVAIAATFLLAYAHAPRRPRVYAWFVFGVSCAASIAGNTAYAMRPLPVWVGAIGAAMCPVFVTLAAHLGVVCWRHCTLSTAVPVPVSVPKPRPAASPHPITSPPAGPPVLPKPAAPTRGRRGGGQRRTTPTQRREALTLLGDGKSAAEAAMKVGVSKRTVEIWRKERDDQHKHDQEGAS